MSLLGKANLHVEKKAPPQQNFNRENRAINVKILTAGALIAASVIMIFIIPYRFTYTATTISEDFSFTLLELLLRLAILIMTAAALFVSILALKQNDAMSFKQNVLLAITSSLSVILFVFVAVFGIFSINLSLEKTSLYENYAIFKNEMGNSDAYVTSSIDDGNEVITLEFTNDEVYDLFKMAYLTSDFSDEVKAFAMDHPNLVKSGPIEEQVEELSKKLDEALMKIEELEARP